LPYPFLTHKGDYKNLFTEEIYAEPNTYFSIVGYALEENNKICETFKHNQRIMNENNVDRPSNVYTNLANLIQDEKWEQLRSICKEIATAIFNKRKVIVGTEISIYNTENVLKRVEESVDNLSRLQNRTRDDRDEMILERLSQIEEDQRRMENMLATIVTKLGRT
jgi:hypothetical protein